MDSLDEQTLRKRRDKASWVPGRERRDYLLNQVGGQQALIEPAPPLPWEAASLGLQFMPRPVQVGDFGAQASAVQAQAVRLDAYATWLKDTIADYSGKGNDVKKSEAMRDALLRQADLRDEQGLMAMGLSKPQLVTAVDRLARGHVMESTIPSVAMLQDPRWTKTAVVQLLTEGMGYRMEDVNASLGRMP